MKTLREGLLKRVHVNGALLRERTTGRKAVRPIVICTQDTVIHTKRIEIDGPATMAFRRSTSPGPYRAKVWIETRAQVRYV